MRVRMMRPVLAALAVGALAVPAAATTAAAGISGGSGAAAGSSSRWRRPPAMAAVLGGHTMDGAAIPCVTEAGGVRVCHQGLPGPGGADLRLRSLDGAPLDIWVTLPAAPTRGRDGRYPLVVQNHGWGAPPSGPDDTQYGGPTARQWAADGYAVVQMAARGWGDSCGTPASREVDPAACAEGYIRLDDVRYEARDVQHVIGLLVDEGIADPRRIGVTGESYGGGVSLELATLDDRVMEPDGRLRRWTSPRGTPLRIAAAAPFAGWSDLVYSLLPNGRTLDSLLTLPAADLSPPGVMKASIVTGLYAVASLTGYLAPTGADPQADVTAWYQAITAGEPYDTPADRAMIETIARYHSPYYLLDGAYGARRRPPAPLFIASGFTDDIFPADEALRYFNLVRSWHPGSRISVLLADIGHQRAQNKPADGARLVASVKAFFDHYLKHRGPRPATGVTALTQTCPEAAPSGGPFRARSWAALHPGEVVHRSAPAQAVSSAGGDPAIARAFDPVLGGRACTTAPAADQGPGVATYRLPAATGAGYTLLGSPTVSADLAVTGEHAYLAARLLDVDPATGTETLVARGVYRIDPHAPDGRQVFQLHPNGWHFAVGHVPKLELLGQDAPYTRPSNGEFTVSVSDLELRLPVHETPGAPGVPLVVTTPLPLPGAGSACALRPGVRRPIAYC